MELPAFDAVEDAYRRLLAHVNLEVRFVGARLLQDEWHAWHRRVAGLQLSDRDHGVDLAPRVESPARLDVFRDDLLGRQMRDRWGRRGRRGKRDGEAENQTGCQDALPYCCIFDSYVAHGG